MSELRRFVLHPELVASAAARGQTIAITFDSDGTVFMAATTNEPPSNDGELIG